MYWLSFHSFCDNSHFKKKKKVDLETWFFSNRELSQKILGLVTTEKYMNPPNIHIIYSDHIRLSNSMYYAPSDFSLLIDPLPPLQQNHSKSLEILKIFMYLTIDRWLFNQLWESCSILSLLLTSKNGEISEDDGLAAFLFKKKVNAFWITVSHYRTHIPCSVCTVIF